MQKKLTIRSYLLLPKRYLNNNTWKHPGEVFERSSNESFNDLIKVSIIKLIS